MVFGEQSDYSHGQKTCLRNVVTVKTKCQLLTIKVKSHLVVLQILTYAQEVVKETSTTHSFLLEKQAIVLQEIIVQALHLNSQFPMGVAENI
jgi:hypothetical protein